METDTTLSCRGDETVGNGKLRALNRPGSDSPIDMSELRSHDKRFSLRPVLVPYSLPPIEWHANWKKAVVTPATPIAGL